MLEEFSLRFALWRRSRAEAVVRHLARRAFLRPPWTPTVGVVRVAAVQMRPRPIRRAEDFADHAFEMTRAAVLEGAEMVVFPDHVTLPLLTLVPGLSEVLAGQSSLDQVLAHLGGDGDDGQSEVGITDVVTVASAALWRVYNATFSTLARRFGIHVAAGSTMQADRDGRVTAICHLYGPRGHLLATQPRVHLSPLERRWGLATADEIRVADCALGRVALAGTMDALYFEPFRVMDHKGVQIALLSQADLGRLQPWRTMRGLWARSQEACLYGVQGALVGRAFGLRFSGPAAIYAPLDLTATGDGVLATAQAEEDDEVVVADLDMRALDHLRQRRGRVGNAAAIGRYLPELYTRPWPWPDGGAAAVDRLPAGPMPPDREDA